MKGYRKPGDKVICINNIGMTDLLKVGETYIIDDYYYEYHRWHVNVHEISKGCSIKCFASRFMSKCEIRKDKLNNLKNYESI